MFLRMELFVNDLKKSAEFYTDVLGFKKGKETDTYISVIHGSAVLGLGAMSQLGDDHYLKPRADHERKGMGVEIILEVDNIEEFYKRIIDKKYPILTEKARRSWGLTDFRILD